MIWFDPLYGDFVAIIMLGNGGFGFAYRIINLTSIELCDESATILGT
jgi:hypothetical protein